MSSPGGGAQACTSPDVPSSCRTGAGHPESDGTHLRDTFQLRRSRARKQIHISRLLLANNIWGLHVR